MPGRSSPRPTAAVAIAPFENPALATGGTGDVLAGAIGSLLAQGLAPFAAARLGVYLHGLAGDGIRERFGDAGLLASDLPDALAIARKRLAALAERRDGRKRLGFAAREAPDVLAAPAEPQPTHLSARARMSAPAARPGPIEARLADAGLPALPRTAWLEIDLDALRGNLRAAPGLAGPGVPVRPVVKADAYGHGAVPVALALEAAGADGFCVAAFDEALELREGGVRGPILVLYPVPAAWTAGRGASRIAVTAGDGTLLDELAAAIAGFVGDGQVRPEAPLGVELEVETGLGRGGLPRRRRWSARRAGSSRHPGLAPGRPVDPFPGGRGRGQLTNAQVAPVRGCHGALARGRDRPAAAPRRRQRRR